MTVTRRTNSASGAYLLRRAAALARSLVGQYAQKTQTLDGYLVRGRKAGDRRTAAEQRA